ncbi:MAG: hypothetical protein H0U79_04400 [Solirubrobacterales bacterium]|nr:hypothetical protein [Solirubrobacterales bacterium]
MSGVLCSWCGVHVDPDDGYRAGEPAGERRAAFCRLEHVVPWVIQGSHWEPGRIGGSAGNGLGRCAWCAQAVGDALVLLVRHRAEHRIADAFCSTDHLLSWAKAGGRWRTVI